MATTNKYLLCVCFDGKIAYFMQSICLIALAYLFACDVALLQRFNIAHINGKERIESAIFTVGISNHLFLIWRKTVCKFTFDSCFDMWVRFGQSTKQSIDSSLFLRRWGTINQWYLTVIHWNMCISSFILINEYFRLAFAYCMVGSNLLDFWQKFQL